MIVFGVTLGLFFLIVLGMSVGMIFAGRRLRGSCGGTSGGSCGKCSPAKQAKCRSEDESTVHADVPIPPSALRRDANLPASFSGRRP